MLRANLANNKLPTLQQTENPIWYWSFSSLKFSMVKRQATLVVRLFLVPFRFLQLTLWHSTSDNTTNSWPDNCNLNSACRLSPEASEAEPRPLGHQSPPRLQLKCWVRLHVLSRVSCKKAYYTHSPAGTDARVWRWVNHHLNLPIDQRLEPD